MRTIATLKAGNAIANREDFQNNGGSLRGQVLGTSGASYFHAGRLPRSVRDYLRGRGDWITYVVTSYGTPIAWHDIEEGWTLPEIKYSVTTSRHQGVVRRAVPITLTTGN